MVSIYRKITYDIGVMMEIIKCMPGNYGAPGEQRNKKQKRTPEDIRKQNERNRWKKLQRIIIANFKAGDWHLILKYKKGEAPDTYEEGLQHRQKFIGQMRKVYKKAGIPFKWIAVTERGKKGKVLHHHLVIEDIRRDGIRTTDLVKEMWTYGTKFFVELYEDGEYEELAEYIVKAEGKEECNWCTYSRSRNLAVPRPKKETIHRRSWRNPPVAPKGWYVVKDSVWNGTNPVTGHPIQHYMIKKLMTTGQDGNGGGSG